MKLQDRQGTVPEGPKVKTNPGSFISSRLDEVTPDLKGKTNSHAAQITPIDRSPTSSEKRNNVTAHPSARAEHTFNPLTFGRASEPLRFVFRG